MASTHVPDFMLSDAAAVLAFLVLMVSVFMVLALALFEMKSEKLFEAIRKAFKSALKKAVEEEVDLEAAPVEEPVKKSRKKKGRRTRSRLSKLLNFFVGDDEIGGADSPYMLDDNAWLDPSSAQSADQKVEAFELPDEVWKSPPVLV